MTVLPVAPDWYVGGGFGVEDAEIAIRLEGKGVLAGDGGDVGADGEFFAGQ